MSSILFVMNYLLIRLFFNNDLAACGSIKKCNYLYGLLQPFHHVVIYHINQHVWP